MIEIQVFLAIFIGYGLNMAFLFLLNDKLLLDCLLYINASMSDIVLAKSKLLCYFKL